jgi:dihydroneopterin aldolase
MFERFTRQARKVIVLAQDEARRLGYNYIGTEHLLLGLIREGEGVAARSLGERGAGLDGAREQVQGIVGYGEGKTNAQAPFTPRSKKVLESALRESLQLGHSYMGTEQILLGLVREGEGVAARVLTNLDIDPHKVRDEVLRGLSGGESGYDPTEDIEGRAGMEEEEIYGALFRGKVGGIGAEMTDPDGDGGGRVPVVVDLDYEYHVARKNSGGFETINYTYVRDLVERFLEACEPSILEEVAGLTCDMLVGEIPRLHKVTVTATREGAGPEISVSATFQS